MELPPKEVESNTTSTRTSAISLGSDTSTITSNIPYTPDGISSGQGITPALITDGARAVGAFCRPFPVATVGTIKKADFDLATSTFTLSVTVSPDDFTQQSMTTEIYLPFVHYAKTLKSGYHDSETENKTKEAGLELDVDIKTTSGTYEIKGQYLLWTYPKPQGASTVTLEVKRKGGAIVREWSTGTGYVKGGSWSDVCGGCVIA
jgi:hypothetical protein